jgi:hypothetical protein
LIGRAVRVPAASRPPAVDSRVPPPAATPPAAVPAAPGDLELPAVCTPQRVGLVVADGGGGVSVLDRGTASCRRSERVIHAGTLSATGRRQDRGAEGHSGDSLP